MFYGLKDLKATQIELAFNGAEYHGIEIVTNVLPEEYLGDIETLEGNEAKLMEYLTTQLYYCDRLPEKLNDGRSLHVFSSPEKGIELAMFNYLSSHDETLETSAISSADVPADANIVMVLNARTGSITHYTRDELD